ncbi:sporulation protein [Zooshikella harenae]|uniref:Sporulation protein n=1 Tax=Zooshikella harenae TaxID=2827238 RepID=A0ABS5ZHN6_9GAMM|nr:sporulation protein [Zooshikella harenae]MBU2713450.1 sporulation protein [Zooshikella harenae]
MFKKILASIGIGSATVDTRLTQSVYEPGEAITGEVYIVGGDTEQHIAGLEHALVALAEAETDEGEYITHYIIQSWKMAESFIIQAGEEKIIPFTYQLHYETPVTQLNCPTETCKVWIQTGLNIDLALDPSDRDYIDIAPTNVMSTFLDAMTECGLILSYANVAKGFVKSPSFTSTSGCYQELDFTPKDSGLFNFKEVEVSFVPENNCTHVMLEIDRHHKGALSAFTLQHDTLDKGQVIAQIKRVLEV